ncbi:MAG: flagellar FlbD family protein [Actinobacteria bacterium]|nr:flagellar FlbD family protein [Actinomycetota bacterium]
MIPVSPLKGRQVFLNADLIEAIESCPDTVLVLANGRRMVIVDSPEVVVHRIGEFRASVLAAVEANVNAAAPRLSLVDGTGE